MKKDKEVLRVKEIRRVKLTDEQYELLWADRKRQDIFGNLVADAMFAAAERLAGDEAGFWAQARDLAQVTEGEDVKIGWLTREIIVVRRDEE